MPTFFENPRTQILENVAAYEKAEPHLQAMGVTVERINAPKDVWALKTPAVGVCHLPSSWPEPPEIGNRVDQPCLGHVGLVIVADSARTGIEASDQALEIQHWALTVRALDDVGPLDKVVKLYAKDEKYLENPRAGENGAGPSAQVLILETTVFPE